MAALGETSDVAPFVDDHLSMLCSCFRTRGSLRTGTCAAQWQRHTGGRYVPFLSGQAQNRGNSPDCQPISEEITCNTRRAVLDWRQWLAARLCWHLPRPMLSAMRTPVPAMGYTLQEVSMANSRKTCHLAMIGCGPRGTAAADAYRAHPRTTVDEYG